MAIVTYPTHSLTRIFPQGEAPARVDRFTALRNEPFSFQLGYTAVDEPSTFYLRIKTDLPLTMYSEKYVAVPSTENDLLSTHYAPGLFPDILVKYPVNPPLEKVNYPWESISYSAGGELELAANRDAIRALWFTVNEDGKNLKAGEYPITVEFYNRKDVLLGSDTVTIKLINATLPRQTLLNTNWFHCDCLADTYGVELWSDEFYRIFRNYITEAARHGMNMLLTPCFTPPLDTSVGGERMTAQLVGVTRTNGEYSFDFSLLKRYLDEARACGITHFEHNALYSQWGAKQAPKVMATVDGKYRLLFGWHTKSTGKAYTDFIDAYLPALTKFLCDEGLEHKMLFHISDEPEYKHVNEYSYASKVMMKHLKGWMVGDPVSGVKLFEEGWMPLPIALTIFTDRFVGKAKPLWTYYTGGQVQEGASNRLIINTPERNRMIGIQMYQNDIQGFLQWAYNFYYGTMSKGLFNPLIDPQAGSTYFVYPAINGTAIPSIRMKIFYEGINDMRALQRLEKLRGKRFAKALVAEFYGDNVTMKTPVESADKLLALRAAINDAIAAAL